jgi:polyisoprenoid-binding protein YceI
MIKLMNKAFFPIVLATLLFVSFKIKESITWKLDGVHSNLGFSILHLSISDIKGTVQLKTGSISAPEEGFSDATIAIEVDMTSIDTDNDQRDEHLKTADFFETSKFPTAIFQSKSFIKNDDGNYTITGNLTLHGITKPVSFTAIIKTALNPMDNKPIAGFKVMGSIKRSDFNISSSTPEAILSDAVGLEANLEFTKE